MAAITQDSKTTNSFSQDSRTAAASLTQDSKSGSGFLWTALYFPWASTSFPWQVQSFSDYLTQDARN